MRWGMAVFVPRNGIVKTKLKDTSCTKTTANMLLNDW
jgi:hypothetical protein